MKIRKKKYREKSSLIFISPYGRIRYDGRKNDFFLYPL